MAGEIRAERHFLREKWEGLKREKSQGKNLRRVASGCSAAEIKKEFALPRAGEYPDEDFAVSFQAGSSRIEVGCQFETPGGRPLPFWSAERCDWLRRS